MVQPPCDYIKVIISNVISNWDLPWQCDIHMEIRQRSVTVTSEWWLLYIFKSLRSAKAETRTIDMAIPKNLTGLTLLLCSLILNPSLSASHSSPTLLHFKTLILVYFRVKGLYVTPFFHFYLRRWWPRGFTPLNNKEENL